MRPLTRPPRQAFFVRLQALQTTALLALAGIGGVLPVSQVAFADPASAPAQTTTAPESTAASSAPAQSDLVRFAADTVTYENDADLVTATGNVVMRRDARSLRADKLVWNRTTGTIVATGNARFVDEDGDVLYTDHIDLTDEFKAGATQDLLLVLREGGRMAAQSSERDAAGHVVLHQAVYSGCEVVDDAGCPKRPSWELTAVRVAYNPDTKMVRYYGAKLRIFGVPLLPLPGLAHASDFHAVSGLLIPTFGSSSANGFEIANTYYWRLADNRDLAVTGTLFTGTLPMVEARYRQLTDKGAFQVNGYLTYSRQTNETTDSSGALVSDATGNFTLRGYIEANGVQQLGNDWSLTGAARYVSDRTFLLRYNLSPDTRLRSTIDLEHVSQDSYFSFAGWAVQAIGVNDVPRQQPFALPSIDYRQRFDVPKSAESWKSKPIRWR